MRCHNLNHMSPCGSQAKLGPLSLPALSWGVHSGLSGSAKPISNPGAEQHSGGQEALGPWGPQRTSGLLAPPARPATLLPAGTSSFLPSPRTRQKGPGHGTQWPFSALPGQLPGLAKAEKTGDGGRNVTGMHSGPSPHSLEQSDPSRPT